MTKKALLPLAALLLAACGGNGSSSVETPAEGDSIGTVQGTVSRVSEPEEIEGTIGDGTTMHSVEIVTDGMDTLYVEIEQGLVAGGLRAGQRIDILYRRTESGLVANAAVNISALEHLWTRPRSQGGTQSLELDHGGHATTYDMEPLTYDRWSLHGGRLLLTCSKVPGVESSGFTDTFDIMMLTMDTLVISDENGLQVYWREN